MSGLKLNIWNLDGTPRRVYVNGLPISGKAWIEKSGSRMSVKFSGDNGGLTQTDVLSMVGSLPGIDITTWDLLVTSVSSTQPLTRGRQPGTTASSRRFGKADAPVTWTADHALDLDPNEMAYAIPEPTTLVVDHREPAEMVDLLRAVRNLEVRVEALEIGDYVVPDRLVIERKTSSDLAASVIEDSKRLFSQTNRMANSGIPSVLLVEGDIYGTTRMSLNSITGTLSYLSVIQGVSIIPTLSLKHSSYMIAKLVRHAVHGLGYDLPLRGSGPKTTGEAARYVLEGIPGISSALAKALIAHFGSVTGVCGATEEELRKVPGIGPSKASKVSEVLHASAR